MAQNFVPGLVNTPENLIQILQGHVPPPQGPTYSWLLVPLISCVGAFLYGDANRVTTATQPEDLYEFEKRLIATLPEEARVFIREIAQAVTDGRVPIPDSLIGYWKKTGWPREHVHHPPYLGANVQEGLMWILIAARAGGFFIIQNGRIQDVQQLEPRGAPAIDGSQVSNFIINLGFSGLETLIGQVADFDLILDAEYDFIPVRPTNGRQSNNGLRGIRAQDMTNEFWSYCLGEIQNFDQPTPWDWGGVRSDPRPGLPGRAARRSTSNRSSNRSRSRNNNTSANGAPAPAASSAARSRPASPARSNRADHGSVPGEEQPAGDGQEQASPRASQPFAPQAPTASVPPTNQQQGPVSPPAGPAPAPEAPGPVPSATAFPAAAPQGGAPTGAAAPQQQHDFAPVPPQHSVPTGAPPAGAPNPAHQPDPVFGSVGSASPEPTMQDAGTAIFLFPISSLSIFQITILAKGKSNLFPSFY